MDRGEDDLSRLAAQEIMLLKVRLLLGWVIGFCTVLGSAHLSAVDARQEIRHYPIASAVTSVEERHNLKLGDSLQLPIARDGRQVLTLSLEAGQFAEVNFIWQGMELI